MAGDPATATGAGGTAADAATSTRGAMGTYGIDAIHAASASSGFGSAIGLGATAGGGQREQPPPELRIESGSSWPSNRSIANVLLHRLGRQNGKIPCLFYHAKTVTENPFFANGCKFPEGKCKGWHLQGSES